MGHRSAGARDGARHRRGRSSGRRLRPVTFVILPVEAVCAVRVGLAAWRLVVLFDNVFDDIFDAVRAQRDPPAEIFDGIVDTLLPGVADGFHCVAGESAVRACAVTQAHEDRVCGVAEMVTTGQTTCLM